jgi:glycosyltransferase involved in cell wall biosynthesis
MANAGRIEDAAPLLINAWRLAPDVPVIAQTILQCAQRLLAEGRDAPAAVSTTQPQAQGKLSFIVCSINPARLAHLRIDLQQHLQNEDWELIHIDDARSLCEGYNRGLRRATGEWLVFCHDDIGILCDHFGVRLRGHLATHDLIGVAGTDRLTGPKWAWAGATHAASRVVHRHGRQWLCGMTGQRGPVLSRAQALDGVFIAGRRDLFEKLGFDAARFDGFHFYDLDLSYRAFRGGHDCAVTADLLIWHDSQGNFNSTYQRYAQRFVDKFPEFKAPPPAVPFRFGGVLVDSLDSIAPMYAWVDVWLKAGPPESR